MSDTAPTREQALAAAIDIVHRRGPAALTLSGLADELNVPINLLAYFWAEPWDLLIETADFIIGQLPDLSGLSWEEQVVESFALLSDRLNAWQEVVPLLSTRGRGLGPGAISWASATFNVIQAGGLDDQTVADVYAILLRLQIGWNSLLLASLSQESRAVELGPRAAAAGIGPWPPQDAIARRCHEVIRDGNNGLRLVLRLALRGALRYRSQHTV